MFPSVLTVLRFGGASCDVAEHLLRLLRESFGDYASFVARPRHYRVGAGADGEFHYSGAKAPKLPVVPDESLDCLVTYQFEVVRRPITNIAHTEQSDPDRDGGRHRHFPVAVGNVANYEPRGLHAIHCEYDRFNAPMVLNPITRKPLTVIFGTDRGDSAIDLRIKIRHKRLQMEFIDGVTTIISAAALTLLSTVVSVPQRNAPSRTGRRWARPNPSRADQADIG